MPVYTVTTKKNAPGAWHDNVENVQREPGTSYETDQERAEQVKERLPEYVDIHEKAVPKKAAPRKRTPKKTTAE